MDQTAEPQPVIHVIDSQLRLYQLHRRHNVSVEQLEVLLVSQNQVATCVVSPKIKVG